MLDLSNLHGFDWDENNSEKNWTAHQVNTFEYEEVFFNSPLLLQPDEAHSSVFDGRYYVLGQTNAARMLFIAFTIRNERIRVISARDMSKKERAIYAQADT